MSEPITRDRRGYESELQDEQAVQRIFIPVVSRGVAGRAVPERIMSPGEPDGALWRDMSGWEIWDGPLTPAGMVSDSNAPGYSLPTFDIPQFGIDRYGSVIVTSEEIWKNTASGWVSLTPQYTEGDCSVVNGSTTVTFTGACRLDTRGHIQAGQLIDPGNNDVWYVIESVDDKKALTLTTAYTGSTATDVDYTIRHNFRCDGGAVRSLLFNDDLIVCWASNRGDEISAICQVENISQTSPSPARFLFSAQVQFFDEEAVNGNVDFNAEAKYITDIEAHTDGRIVATVLVESGAGVLGNRTHYSSPTDRYQWSREPGGFTDLVGIRGNLGAVKRYGEQVLFHFSDGIMAGFETGLTEPPFNNEINPLVFRGATHPRTVVNTSRGQFYASLQSSTEDSPGVYVFDGSGSTPVSDQIRDSLEEDISFSGNPTTNGGVWAYANEKRHSYHLFVSESLSALTTEYVYYWDVEQWTKTARATNLTGFGGESDAYETTTKSRLVSTKAVDGALGDWFRVLTNAADLCTTDGGFLHASGRYLRSEWLDARRPGYDKSWLQVLLWIDMQTDPVTNPLVSLPITCQLVARDDSDSSPRATTAESITVTKSSSGMSILQFSFDPFLAEAVQIRLSFDTANAGLALPLIHHAAIDFALIGQGEASGALTQ